VEIGMRKSLASEGGIVLLGEQFPPDFRTQDYKFLDVKIVFCLLMPYYVHVGKILIFGRIWENIISV
jgi:hypothetical protein